MAGLLGLINASGGLEGLTGKLKPAGMEEKSDSWVSKGENAPATADDVKNALGQEQIAQIAQQAGVSEEDASSQLATMIPETVNQLTPGGELPDQRGLDALLVSMGGKLPESLRPFISGGSS